MNSVKARTAHPYKDLDVIDARAPRFNQTVVALLTIGALLTGWWPLAGAMGLQLAIGLKFGRQYCLTCLFYFEVLQPRFGEGPVEDSRAPRFANILGAIFLNGATAAFLLGATTVGWAVIGMVAVLATLAATTGLCVGCEMYRFIARFRGVRPGHIGQVDLKELGATNGHQVVVHFTHPLCSDCQSTAEELSNEGHDLVLVDVSKRPDLARKYHVSIVPTSFSVTASGKVLERLA